MTKNIKEEGPVNGAGGGAIAGIGVGPQGEPGIDKRRKRIIMDARAEAKAKAMNESEKVEKKFGAYHESGHCMYTFNAKNSAHAREVAASMRKRSDFATHKIRLVKPDDEHMSEPEHRGPKEPERY